MSNQGYYGGAPQQPQQAYYGPPQGQPQYYQQGPPQQQQQYYPPQQQMGYQQGPPPQQQRQSGGKGCFEGCIAALCCCFVCEEGCECLEMCC